jgi:hypothetical protein
MTDDDLDPLAELVRAATPGPWRWWTSCSFRRLSSDATGKAGDVLHGVIHHDGVADVACSDEDAAFIAAARAAVPELIAEVRRLREALHVADEVLALCTTRDFPAPEDPTVRALGERIGYGAVMSAASKEWRDMLRREHGIADGQHTCGPGAATVRGARAKIAGALQSIGSRRERRRGVAT